ncbi:MAG: hypothetical protein DHS20C18_00290 [Saprospiraceae bacterium]|nr:MAG: hypothetical protein DHS20C18_00290 [Saprospiraceae bacterium]
MPKSSATTFSDRQVNIFIDSKMERFPNRNLHQHNKKGVFIRAVDNRHFDDLINNLHPDTPILIFLHLEKSQNGNSPPGLGTGAALKRQYEILKKKGLIYLSSDDNSKKKYEGLDPEDKVDLFTSFLDLVQTEEPIRVRELKSDTVYRKIKRFTFEDQFDWNVRSLMNHINEASLCEIIGTVLEEEIYDDYLVDVLTPGFTGAFVLKISCTKNNKTDFYLLKMSKDDAEIERERKNGKLAKLARLGKLFITAINQKEKYYINGWSCLLFDFEDKGTLKAYLQQKIKDPNSKILPAIQETIKKFDHHFYKVLAVENQKKFLSFNLSPYKGGSFKPFADRLEYEGLKLKPPTVLQVQRSLYKITERCPKSQLQKYQVDKAIEKLNQYLDFAYDLARPPFKSAFTSENVLLGFVHGDFHSANALVDKDGINPVFIDLVSVPEQPIKHAFLDVGKLSTDFEISILPGQLIFNNPKAVAQWMDYHQKWMQEVPLGKAPRALQVIYEAQTWIVQFLKENYGDQIPPQCILRQFHMVRLHYFLKAIGYFYEDREKIFFFIRASSDILEYLENNQP